MSRFRPGRVRRARPAIVGAIVVTPLMLTFAIVGRPSYIDAATKTTTPSAPKSGSSDRIQAEGLALPDTVKFNRSVNAKTPLNVRASFRLSDDPKPYGFSGRVDPQTGTAQLFSKYDNKGGEIRLVGDLGYQKVDAADRETYLADWISFKVKGTAIPLFGIIGRTVVARPVLLSSVKSWKKLTAAAFVTPGLTRYRGLGNVTALALDKAQGFKPDVRVDIWVDDATFIRRIDWRIFPDDTPQAQGVTSTTTYAPGTPLPLVAPKGRIADFEALVAASNGDTTPATAG